MNSSRGNMEYKESDKKFPDRHKFFSLRFFCEKCEYFVDTFNYCWKEDVPAVCPKCKEGGMYYRTVAPNFIDRNKAKEWVNNTSLDKQVDVLTSEKDPY